jgi:hypothetical protein
MRWTEVDRGLAEGLLAYEASLNRWGFPDWLARDPEERFAPDDVMDYAEAAFEANEAAARRSKAEPNPGARISIRHMGRESSAQDQVQDEPEE